MSFLKKKTHLAKQDCTSNSICSFSRSFANTSSSDYPLKWSTPQYLVINPLTDLPSLPLSLLQLRCLCSAPFFPHSVWVCVHVCLLLAQSCPTLCNLKDCSLPGSSVYGILQARVVRWVAIPFSQEIFLIQDWTWVSCIADSLLSKPLGNPFHTLHSRST